MISIDTNVLVRLLTNDDIAQAKHAANLIENNPIFISKSVLLETEWVLRYVYNLNSTTILNAFESVLGVTHVTVEDPISIAQTLEWYSHDIDFADALHFASSPGTMKFATFDKQFIKKAKKLNINLLAMD